MLQSTLFTKTLKKAPADADSRNAQLLTQGGFIQRQMAGVYNFLPLGLRVLRKIEDVIRGHMEALGAQEILMPALTQKESYVTTGRDGLDILFKLKGPRDADYFLNQSHEEVVTPLVQKHVLSYRDLPVAVFQIQNKFRNEPRARSGILRGREFVMKDLYSFHATEDDLNAYYASVTDAYFRIFDQVGIGKPLTVLTYASGGSFSKYSHEFQTLCDAGEDTVYLCTKCMVAVNKELIHEQNACPECGNKKLEERSAIEVGNIFKLKTRFTDAFGFMYTDEGGTARPVHMGCYGLGPSRVMGTLVEVFNDKRGIRWPASVAPFRVHLIGLDLSDASVAQRARETYEAALKAGIETLFDDRVLASAGEKFAEADLIGIPWRWVVSKKTGQNIEVKRRDSDSPELFELKKALEKAS